MGWLGWTTLALFIIGVLLFLFVFSLKGEDQMMAPLVILFAALFLGAAVLILLVRLFQVLF